MSSGAARSRRRAMGSWPSSMAPREPFGAASRWRAPPERIGLAIRVGVHTGEVEFVGPDARGLAVHTAARVMSFAGSGEVLVSSTTKDLLEGSGLVLEDAGAHELKGIAGERHLFRIGASDRA